MPQNIIYARVWTAPRKLTDFKLGWEVLISNYMIKIATWFELKLAFIFNYSQKP
jgi:hypothetical protein